MIGRGAPTILGWEQQGLIPKPQVVDHGRRYLKRQVTLLKKLARFMDKKQQSRIKAEGLDLDALTTEIKEKW
jgi:hypothetical protein